MRLLNWLLSVSEKVTGGWRKDSTAHAEAGRKGGLTTAAKYGTAHFAKIGKKGGRAK